MSLIFTTENANILEMSAEENACRERTGEPDRVFISECTIDRLTEDAGSSSFLTGGSEAVQCEGRKNLRAQLKMS